MDLGLVTLAVILLLVLVVFIGGVRAYFYYFRLWFRAQRSSGYVPIPALVGMTLRRVNPRVIVDAYIVATRAGLNLGLRDLEAHYQAGKDVSEVVQALIAAKEADLRRGKQDAGAAEAAGEGAFEGAHTSA